MKKRLESADPSGMKRNGLVGLDESGLALKYLLKELTRQMKDIVENNRMLTPMRKGSVLGVNYGWGI